MDARLKRYYLKKMSGGRSIAARVVDFVLLRAVMLIAIFVLMLQWSHSLTVAISVAVFITAAFSITLYLYKRKKAEKFFKRDMQRLREKCLLETLTLMNSLEYAEYMGRLFSGMGSIQAASNGFLADYKGARMAVLHNHPSSECGVAQAVDAYRLCKDAGKIVIVSLSEFSGDAKKFADSVAVTLVSGREVLRIAGEKGLLPDEQSAERRSRQEMEETIISMARVKRVAFSRAKIRTYIFCGLITMLWPLFSGWRFYYAIISLLCFAMAYISYRRGKHTQESADIDLT